MKFSLAVVLAFLAITTHAAPLPELDRNIELEAGNSLSTKPRPSPESLSSDTSSRGSYHHRQEDSILQARSAGAPNQGRAPKPKPVPVPPLKLTPAIVKPTPPLPKSTKGKRYIDDIVTLEARGYAGLKAEGTGGSSSRGKTAGGVGFRRRDEEKIILEVLAGAVPPPLPPRPRPGPTPRPPPLPPRPRSRAGVSGQQKKGKRNIEDIVGLEARKYSGSKSGEQAAGGRSSSSGGPAVRGGEGRHRRNEEEVILEARANGSSGGGGSKGSGRNSCPVSSCRGRS